MYVFFIILIVPWLILSGFKIKKWRDREKRCTLKVCVQVTDILVKRPRRGSDLVYKPVFTIYFTNTTIDSALYTNLYHFTIGQKLWIRINPNDIQDFIYESPYKEIEMGADVLCCVIPLVVLVIYSLCLIL